MTATIPAIGSLTYGELSLSFLAVVVATYVFSFVYHRFVLRIGGEGTVTMFDGARIAAISGDVGAVGVYKEMYQDNVYFAHGVSLEKRANPVVIDAGVNIGLFSRFIAEKFPTAKVFGAEPIDVLATCAKKNNTKFGDRVKILQAGLGKKAGAATISYKPTLTSASTMHVDEVKECAEKNAVEWICGLIIDGQRLGEIPFIFSPLIKLLHVHYLRVLVLLVFLPVGLWVAAWKIGGTLSARSITCKIVTVDEMLKTLGAPTSGKIDLLKIDVEGAEMDVLEGISDELWSRIDQAVIEIHDLHGRADKIKRLLASKGFTKLKIDTEVWEVHRLLNLVTIFALKA